MKKTTLIIILGVLTICCIILGSIKHLGGTFKKSKVTEYSRDFDYEEKDSFSQKLEAFSAIKMSCSIAEIKIEEGDNFKIESQYNKEILKPTFSVKDGKLEVFQKENRGNSFLGGNHNCKILITLPAKVKLDDININSNIGDVRLREFTAERIKVNLNIGEVSVRNLDFENIEINNNIGEISIDPTGSLEDYDISINSDIGEVNVNGKRYRHNYTKKSASKKSIKANTNIGEIRIK